MLKIDFICPLPNGLHARPAWELKEQCAPFASEMTFINHRLNQQADAKSSLALISTGTLFNDPCSLEIKGIDEEKAWRILEPYIQQRFADSDSEIQAEIPDHSRPLPRSLLRLNPTLIYGNGIAPGVGEGQLLIFRSTSLEAYRNQPASVQDNTLLEHSLATLAEQLNQQLLVLDGQSKPIINAHLSLIQDNEFGGNIRRQMAQHRMSLGAAVLENMHTVCQKLSQSASEYLRERVSDIQDITVRLLQIAYPHVTVSKGITLVEPTILVADDITPSQFLSLDKAFLQGMVLAKTGRTSHTLILARAAGVPVLSGIETAQVQYLAAEFVIIDANGGVLVTQPDDAVRGYYKVARNLAERQHQLQLEAAGLKALTADGVAIELSANIGSALEAPAAFANGAEGVGLFRTEMLFMDRDSAPDEQEQFEAYQQVLLDAGDRPVIFRTMDIGGDKKISYLNIGEEENPFLGYRAVRIYPEFTDLFTHQLRAILRAAAWGKARLMIPMVHTLDEILWVKQQLKNAIAALKEEGLRHASSIELGIMIEVPSVCFIIDHFCDEVDFFSIGSNDMTQYLYAVDRNNPRVAHLYNPITPSFLRMLRQIIEVAHKRNRWVGICGELGGETRYLPLLLGLGIDEFSMSSTRIPAAKALLRQLDSAACRKLAAQICECRSGEQIEQQLDAFALPQHHKPLLALENIIIPAAFTRKEQVIQYLCGNLAIQGRTHNPQELEEDIWAREEIVTTAVGFGVAIPHTKSQHIQHSSISIARLPQPIDWESEMGEVELVIMLTLGANEGMNHVKVFSQLARKLVNKTFRQALFAANSAEEMLALLENELQF
ncbi:phosphoenolpyruvate--protein phosphotransferase [Buttiauxella selenatireducens]|uniref:Phosphoenolpyruvate--protein phosphotransferase n=1 Tax=Buttiauxella selenatireducens TaxID=3073902 RepID=A0ABY9S842_9ENTR|nr:phosphoenolpyruvate--protein phosphotransferase [Buttiauxella sp. R73]WMY73316.1 phosphoenolpyruvate--protein phosphotransferase [Buttiauxella sp. R73]